MLKSQEKNAGMFEHVPAMTTGVLGLGAGFLGASKLYEAQRQALQIVQPARESLID